MRYNCGERLHGATLPMKSFFRDTLLTLVLAAVIFFGLRAVVQNFSVEGPSMSPNFQDGQMLMVNKVVYYLHEPERGDVVILIPPFKTLDNKDYIKRIIGLPGESVEIRDNKVYIHQGSNVFPLDETYLHIHMYGTYTSGTIPPDSYFVLGDNRNNSSDSRGGWFVPEKNIVGKVWVSIWPPSMWGLAANHVFAR